MESGTADVVACSREKVPMCYKPTARQWHRRRCCMLPRESAHVL